MRRGIGDLRKIPDDESYVPGREPRRDPAPKANGRRAYAPRPTGTPELVVEESDVLAPETRFDLKDGETSVGRSSASDVVLKSDDYASGRHAQLTRHGGLLYVEDLGSTNGTFVNGSKTVGATPVRNGDNVRIGSTTFRYEE
ncbi:MAG: FHA domain-containing protein [Rubrobacter sp.]|nr:FHA domain-containing protein [Rubrobacter sp.]MBA3953046.1 FHA domain-containing protein [Rubrobacter sp.]